MNLWLLGRELILSPSSRVDTSLCAEPAVCVFKDKRGNTVQVNGTIRGQRDS